MNAVEKLAVRYKELIGSPPEGIWFAPGRVNLIGEHTDYNDGFVLPFALEQRALVAAGLREDARVVMPCPGPGRNHRAIAPRAQAWYRRLAGLSERGALGAPGSRQPDRWDHHGAHL